MSPRPARTDASALLDLLPALYRLRDTELARSLNLLAPHDRQDSGPLASLLAVLAEQVAAIEENLDQLYDDQFVETAADWALPYIGDLIGYEPLHGVVPRLTSPRAEVANTIAFRRRKGTASMLEQLARDVTGWPARAVEFFQLLGWTQHMNHLRREAHYAPDLRRSQRLLWQETPFDTALHTVNVRRPEAGGRHNIPNVGLFLARLEAHSLTRSPAIPDPLDPARLFRFDPRGVDIPLFTNPVTEDEISHLAEPLNLPLPIDRRWMSAHLEDYYGPGKSLVVETASANPADPPRLIPLASVRVCHLGDVLDGGGSVVGWAHVPAPDSGKVAIDPVLGRIAFAEARTSTVLTTFHYGATTAIGGGEYERGEASPGFGPVRTVRTEAALALEVAGAPTSGTIEVADSRRYAAPTAIRVAAGDTLVLRARNGSRPFVHRAGDLTLDIGADGTLILDGLVLAGVTLRLPAPPPGDVATRRLVIRHCTLVPGSPAGPTDAPGLVVENPFATVEIEASIVAPIHVVEDVELHATDTIIDATDAGGVAFRGPAAGLAPGGALRLQAVTVVGRVHAREVEATNVLFVARHRTADGWRGPLWVDRRQTGCVRFSFVPPGSRTPRQFQCLPREGDASLWPSFTSLSYGEPGYGQLADGTSEAIRRGADDEGEIGALHRLYQPQRETNLRLRLQEYLRFGLEAGVFYIT